MTTLKIITHKDNLSKKYKQCNINFGKMLFLLTLITVILFSYGCSNNQPNTPTPAIDGVYVYGDFTYRLKRTFAVEDFYFTISGYTGLSETVVIPDMINGLVVTALEPQLFKGHSEILNIIIPETVVYIGYEAFKGTKWYESLNDDFVIVGDGVLIKYNNENKDVVIPKDVKHISACAFKDRIDTTSIELNDGITRLEEYVFYGCKTLSQVKGMEQIAYIGKSAFESTNIYEFTAPLKTTVIKEKTFYNCNNLKIITLHNSIKTIEDYAFANCVVLETIKLKDMENDQVNYQYGLQGSVVLPKSLEFIGKDILTGSDKIKDISIITIREGVTSIRVEDIKYIVEPGLIYMPKSVTDIDPNMFKGFSDLTFMVYEGSYAMEYAKLSNIKYVIRSNDLTNPLF